MVVYLDTGALIALHEPKDENHDRARATLRRLSEKGTLMALGVHTLLEFADGLERHYGQRPAAQAVAALLESPRIRLQPSDPYLSDALTLFRQRPNWKVDLSDCVTFALMRGLGMTSAFTYDGDFAKAGFSIEA